MTPSATISREPTPVCAIGVDVGGTKIAAGLVSFPDGRVLARLEVPTRPERGGEVILQEVERLVGELCATAQSSGEAPAAIGLGVCEIVRPDGTFASAQTIGWLDLPVRDRLNRFAPTRIEADVRAAARAEARFGAGRGTRVFLYVTIGTGIASCLVIDGEPFAGAQGATGTMASGPMPHHPRADGGTAPSLESIGSGPALVGRFNALGGNVASGREVIAAADSGDGRALGIVVSAGTEAGAAIGALVNVLDPERVIMGGGLGLNEGPYRNALITAMREHVWWAGHRSVPLLSAATGADAGIIGAAAAAFV